MLRRFSLLAAAVVSVAISVITLPASDPPAPDKGTAKYRVPPGFVVERVAGAPLVRYPLFAAFDERGRLFVAEGTGTNLPGDELAKKKLGRIVVLEDTDGDGRFDTSRVFVDELVFPQGVLWHDGALYSASHPSFWKFTETKDGKVRREELLTGFKFNGNGCDIHGPFLGPDGRLYWTDGRHGYKVKTRDGEVIEGFASRVWRCRPDGTDVERVAGGGFDNPVQIAFTDDGEAIGTMDQGPGDALLHYVEGGVYPMEHPCLKEFAWTGPLLGAVQQYSPAVPAALCGFTRSRSAQFGKDYQGTFFSTHYMLHKIVQNRLIRDGSTFRAEDRDFLTSTDHDVHLTDVIEDADGSLLFVDMGAWFTYGFPGNPLPRPDVKGGIYRIRRTDAPQVKDPSGKSLEIEKRTAAELTTLLDDARPRVRDQVIARLARLGADAVPELAKTLQPVAARSVDARRNAIWALCRIPGLDARTAIRNAILDKHVEVQLAAAHAAGLERDGQAQVFLETLVSDAEMHVRRKAAESLGRLGRAQAVPALLEALGKKNDRFLEHTVTYALIRIADRTATLATLKDANPRVRQAGLIALDQMPKGDLTRELVLPLLETEDDDLQHTVLQVVSRRPDWSAGVSDLLAGWLRQGIFTVARERSLSSTLLSFAGQANIKALVINALADAKTPTASRLLLLRIAAQMQPDPGHGWIMALGPSLEHAEPAVRRAAIAAVKATGLKHFDAQLMELSRQPKLPAELRVAALECLAERRENVDGESFALLLGQLSEKSDPVLRLAAARTLGASRLNREQLGRLADAIPNVNTMVLRQLLGAFALSSDANVGKALVAALERSAAAEALNTAEIDRALKKQPAEVADLAGPLRKKMAAREENQVAYLAKLKAELSPLKANPNLGRFVFFSSKAGCATCHRAEGKGGQIGPDLSKIGLFRSAAGILESIVFPSLTIAPEYRTYQIQTRDGKLWNGLITWEAPDAVSLRTAQLTEVRILRKDIEELSPSRVSLMPDGLERTLNRQELRDLVEFLVQRK
jgi:putative heme-binding domain-containing protein